ncbi:MAG: hypothetical protein LBT09_10135 [Planctomycetaceae bacterium]|nr:hypothetical protein [Planctomycetaceae bacterium]
MLRNLICILFTTTLILVVVNTVYAEKYKDVQSLRYEFEDGGKVDKTDGRKIDIRETFPNCNCPCKPIVFAPIERDQHNSPMLTLPCKPVVFAPIERGNACRYPAVVYSTNCIYSTNCRPNAYYQNNTCRTPHTQNIRYVPNVRQKCTNFTIIKTPPIGR